MSTSDIQLSIIPAYVERLIVKLRAIEAREPVTDPNPGSNPTDDNMIDTLQDGAGDLSALEFAKEVEGLDEQQQNELVALMWIGRGDSELEEWPDVVKLAAASRDTSTASYILGNPMAAEYLSEGLSRLGIEVESSSDE